MKNWKKLLICCVSFTLAYFANVAADLACGGEIDPYDYYISFYHNNLQGEKDYSSFYFTDFQYLYNDAEPASETDINAAEWAAYLGKPVKTADVKKAMYGLDSAGNAAINQQFLVDKRSIPDSLAHNTFLQTLVSAQHKSALQYYRFAKEAEPVANFSYRMWEPTPVDTVSLRNAASKAFNFASAEKDNFLKLRYAYQAERLFHYGADYAKAKSVYTRFIDQNLSKSHVKGWALALKAGEERKLGDILQSAYLFSKVFADYPERRVQAYRNYHYLNLKEAQVLPLAKTDADKAVIYAMEGFGNPEINIDYLQKVYRFAPASPMVGVLLLREVNKLETYFLTEKLHNLTDSAAKSQTKLTLISSEKISPKNNKLFGWLLFAGSVLLVSGVIGFSVKNKPIKPAWKITCSLLLLAGGGSMGYAVFTRQKTALPLPGNIRANPAFFTKVADSVQRKYNNHIEDMVQFCDQLTTENKYPEAAIGNLTKAYLCWMQGKTADGFNAAKASEKDKLSLKMQDQQQIVMLLLSAQNIQQVDSVHENKLLPTLKWLDGKVKSTPTEVINASEWLETRINRFATTSRDFYLHILAPAYLHQQDTARAAVALLKSESYGDELTDYPYMKEKPMPDFWYNYLRSKQLTQIISWKENPPETAWLQFLTVGLKQIPADKLYELLGTAYLREHNYAAAVAAFARRKSTGKRSIDNEEGDPFTGQPEDYPKSFSAAGAGFTKSDFAKAMAQLQEKMKAEPQNPQLYYRFATALYNTSTYGNSWNLISYNWSSIDFARRPIYTYDADYIQTSNAERYYLLARNYSKNPDFKAKCTFMAAKCRQKQQALPTYLSNYDAYQNAQKNYSNAMRHNPYFKELRPYQQTEFYKTAVAECSYLRDFLKKE